MVEEEDHIPFPEELPELKPRELSQRSLKRQAKRAAPPQPRSRTSPPEFTQSDALPEFEFTASELGEQCEPVHELTVDPEALELTVDPHAQAGPVDPHGKTVVLGVDAELAGPESGPAPARRMVPVRLGVRYYFQDHVFKGTLVALATRRALLRTVPPRGLSDAFFLLELPIPMGGSLVPAHIVCKVLSDKAAGGERNRREIKLSLETVEEEPAPMAFQRYVSYLLYRAIKSAKNK